MSTQRKMRAAKRAEQTHPINYTCGVCGKVHEYDPNNPYVCPDAISTEEESE